MALKRIFLLLPVIAFIAGCWITITSLITLLFRPNRQNFFVALIITWWDLGKTIFSFWAGIVKFVFIFIHSILVLLKIAVLGIWSILQTILIFPFRFLGRLGRNFFGSSVPVIAIILTVLWCIIEASIFTYVTTPLVIDVFSNITGDQLREYAIQIPLFIFLFFIVLGSYAVLSTFLDTVKSKKISSIFGITVIEIIVLLVEVLFLYREFVDALIPWFAQYSDNFNLGIIGTLAVACFVWFGIRSLSWFLFASYGTPTLLKIIQGKAIIDKNAAEPKPLTEDKMTSFFEAIKKETEWAKQRGEEIISSIMLPPLQIIAATINFAILLITAKHLFELPFNSFDDITSSKSIISNIAQEKKKGQAKQRAQKNLSPTKGEVQND
ncbi:MAG: hypothetical protein JW976_09275 [Syntrophaceae bacterium]|nr:hypothetical protein [Syntrophaceae bacterium]